MTLSPALLTLYADFVQQVRDRQAKPGSVYRQTKGGTEFLYVRRSVGVARIDEYLGSSSNPGVAARAGEIRREQNLARGRRKIVSALKRAGVPAPGLALGRVLDCLSDAGLFKSGVLVGTAAYHCYSPLVGASLPSASLMTQDADVAIAELAIGAEGGVSMLDVLQRADPTFRELPGLRRSVPPVSFRSDDGFRVDLLTPLFRRSDRNPMPLRNLRAGAIPLQYLGWLIAEPVDAVALAGAGVPVRVPEPARYAVHKLILAQRRRADERIKRQKDLLQARALILALRQSDPAALATAFRSAQAKGREGWGKPIGLSLAEIEAAD